MLRKKIKMSKMADFLNALTSRIFEVFFERFFAPNNCYVVESFFPIFGRLVLILSQSDYFAKAVAFAYLIGFVRLLIFKIVSFLEYLVFFSRGFLCKATVMWLWNHFPMF